MSIESIEELLAVHPFFLELPRGDVRLIAGCGTNQVFKSGEFIAHEGDAADQFFVIRSGVVAVQIFVPERGEVTLQTLKHGDILGWSWLFPPYRWTFDAKAMETLHMIALNGKCLREKAENDPGLGYRLMKKFAQIMTERLHSTRLQLLDVYGVR